MNRQNSSKNGSIRMTDCVIFAGADMDLSCVDISKDSFVICADRGVLHAQELDVKPDLIVGDFDSLGYVPQSECRIIKFKPEKDDTDLMIAIKQSVSLGYKDVKIFAALGGRLDHTIASIQSLAYALDHGIRAQLISKTETVDLYDPGEYAFERKDAYSLSLFSYSKSVTGLCISGAKYEVENAQINDSFPLGVSNEITGEKAVISFRSGRLLVIRSSLVTTF